MKILLVEDDPKIARIMKSLLQSHKYVVDVFDTARKGLKQALMIPYDCIILDLYLPDFTGDTIARSIRVHKKHIPILMVTAESVTAKKVELLDMCDDYITKPFHMEELVARVRAVLRRGKVVNEDILESGDLVMDVKNCSVKKAGREIKLRNKEYKLLEFLLRHKGEVITREQIIDSVWDRHGAALSFNLVDVHVRMLRKKIDTNPKQSCIQTISGRGYRVSSYFSAQV